MMAYLESAAQTVFRMSSFSPYFPPCSDRDMVVAA